MIIVNAMFSLRKAALLADLAIHVFIRLSFMRF